MSLDSSTMSVYKSVSVRLSASTHDQMVLIFASLSYDLISMLASSSTSFMDLKDVDLHQALGNNSVHRSVRSFGFMSVYIRP